MSDKTILFYLIVLVCLPKCGSVSETFVSLLHVQLRQKITSATSAIKSVFGKEDNQPDAVSPCVYL